MFWDKGNYREPSDEPSSSDLSILIDGATSLGIPLTNQIITRFERYQQELITWNQRVNLTSITEPAEIQRRHFLDSLTCLGGARDLFAQETCAIIDIGSGAGFPGIPLKLALPSLRVTLVETRGKRATFIQHIVDTLELKDVQVISDRAEVLGQVEHHRQRYDVALARALGSLSLIAELCVPLLRVGGACIAPRRGDFESESKAAQPAFDVVGGSRLHWIPVHLVGLDDGRGLVVSEKVSPTPTRFPRRAGIPGKRPLA